MPIGYYTFLRIVITLGAMLIFFNEMQKEISLYLIAFTAITILFNPLIPIYLYKKSIWIPLDILSGFIFLIYGFKEKTTREEF
jgi:hypothetical protein